MSKVANLLFGERYGDVNDPKTSWKNVGMIMVRQSQNQEPDAADVEALKRLVAAGHISVRIDAVPTSKMFDGWLSVFEPRDFSQGSQGTPVPSDYPESEPVEASEDAVDLSEIPF